MAWTKYTPTLPKTTNSLPAVSITIPSTTKAARPFLSVDGETLKKLGWKAGATLQLQIGEAEHAGKIRIEALAGASTVLSSPPAGSRRKRSRVVLGRMPGLTDEDFKAEVAFEIDGLGALVVTLPDEARGHQLPAGTAAAIRRAQGK